MFWRTWSGDSTDTSNFDIMSVVCFAAFVEDLTFIAGLWNKFASHCYLTLSVKDAFLDCRKWVFNRTVNVQRDVSVITSTQKHQGKSRPLTTMCKHAVVQLQVTST